MLTMIVAIYELERANMLERQREGIVIAKGKGAYQGRKSKNRQTGRRFTQGGRIGN